jgi:hypothetical protein
MQEKEAKEKDIVSQQRCNAGGGFDCFSGGGTTSVQVPKLWKVGSQKE